MVYKQSPGEKAFNIFNMIVLAFVGLIALYPFLYTLSISLSTQAEAMSGGLHLYPRHLSFMSYVMVFKNPEIAQGYFNTIFRTIIGTLASVFATCLAAFPLSRKSLPLRGSLTFFILFTMLFGGGLIPTFLLDQATAPLRQSAGLHHPRAAGGIQYHHREEFLPIDSRQPL